MNPLIERHRDEIDRLCRQHRVRRLEVFGSCAQEGRFRPEESDLDFLVEFLPLAAGRYADAYFGLLEGLQELFQRPVDLVVRRAIRNRYFLEKINESSSLVYAA